jgi:hypothetical protein
VAQEAGRFPATHAMGEASERELTTSANGKGASPPEGNYKAVVYVWEGQTIEHKNPMTAMRTLAMAFRERGILASFRLAEKEIV